jgi:hypothetical protein
VRGITRFPLHSCSESVVHRRRTLRPMTTPRSIAHTILHDYAQSLRQARDVLDCRSGLQDELVHRARKDLKRARAALHLLRPSLSRQSYEMQKTAIRSAAAALGGVRDCRVICAALDRIEPACALSLPSPAHRLRLQLIETSQRARDRLSGKVMQDLRETLARALEAIAAEPVRFLSRAVVARELAKRYRKGRIARDSIGARQSAGRFHEWRKQTQCLRYQLSILKRSPRLRRRLRRVAELLGEDHDLWMLSRTIRRLSQHTHAYTEMLSHIRRRRSELQRAAARAGRMAYRRAPSEFEKRWRRGLRSVVASQPATDAISRTPSRTVRTPARAHGTTRPRAPADLRTAIDPG